MYIYNTTYLVGESLLPKWKTWIEQSKIPMMQRFGFYNEQIARVLSENTEDGISISVQFRIDSIQRLTQWRRTQLDAMRKELYDLFGTEVLSFDTILEVL